MMGLDLLRSGHLKTELETLKARVTELEKKEKSLILVKEYDKLIEYLKRNDWIFEDGDFKSDGFIYNKDLGNKFEYSINFYDVPEGTLYDYSTENDISGEPEFPSYGTEEEMIEFLVNFKLPKRYSVTITRGYSYTTYSNELNLRYDLMDQISEGYGPHLEIKIEEV